MFLMVRVDFLHETFSKRTTSLRKSWLIVSGKVERKTCFLDRALNSSVHSLIARAFSASFFLKFSIRIKISSASSGRSILIKSSILKLMWIRYLITRVALLQILYEIHSYILRLLSTKEKDEVLSLSSDSNGMFFALDSLASAALKGSWKMNSDLYIVYLLSECIFQFITKDFHGIYNVNILLYI